MMSANYFEYYTIIGYLRMPFFSWTHWTSAKLCGIEQWAPTIFGRAAITLGIGPHSSLLCIH